MNWRRFFFREQADAEQREELELYLDLTADEYRERGMAPAEARAAAQRKLGNMTLIAEEVYRMNTFGVMEDAFQDMRHALRMIWKTPGFSAAALVSLAVGIGANTAVFSVVDSVLIRPLPYPEPDTLVRVASTMTIQGQRFEDVQLSPGLYGAYRDDVRAFERFGVYSSGAATVTGIGDPEQVVTVTATQGVLPVLGVPAYLGRWFSAEDDSPGTAETVILSHGYWQRRLGGDPSVLGRTITIDFIPRQVIGVMPREFRFLDRSPDVFLPQRMATRRPDAFSYDGIARLRKGTSITPARAETASALKSWGEANGMGKILNELQIQPTLRPLKESIVGNFGAALQVLMAALGLVLLLVCANVASLVLARAQSRRQEFAVRAALGAGWGRITRELLVESLTLGLLGGALGLVLAYAGLRVLVVFGPANLPRLGEISLDAAALLFVLGCSLVLSLLFGLAAVLKCGRPGQLQNARGATPGAKHLRAQSGLVVTQVALALVLLVASGLVIRTFVALRAVTPGFTDPERVQMVRISIPEALEPEPERVIRTQAEMLARLAAIPGVEAAGFASGLPLELEHNSGIPVAVDGKTALDRVPPNRAVKVISPGLLAAQGTQLVAGRDFTWEDVFGQRYVTAVSETMARENWGEPASALGKRIRIGRDGPWTEVVGVVQDVHSDGVDKPAPAIVYVRAGVVPPNRPGGSGSVRRGATFAIRTGRAGTQAFLQDVTAAIHGINASVPLDKVRTLEDVYRLSTARTSFSLVLLGIAGAMALTLAIVGLYGVLSYAVAQRRREIGIRLALGAEARRIKTLFVRQGLILASVGCLIGLTAAAGLSRWIASLLFGVSPLDPPTFAIAGVIILAAAVAASYFPAQQAASVDPMDTLRNE
jgi:predicted permease